MHGPLNVKLNDFTDVSHTALFMNIRYSDSQSLY